MTLKPLLISARWASALGFLAITLTGEMSPIWLAFSWSAWVLSFWFDRYPDLGRTLKRWETAAVLLMVVVLVLDFFAFRNTLFIAVTHFLLLFQMVKMLGGKSRKDCLQIFLFSFFHMLAACTLSVDAWLGAVLLLFIPTSTAALYWNQMARETEIVQSPMSKVQGQKDRKTLDLGLWTLDFSIYQKYRRMASVICAVALPMNLFLTIAIFVVFPRLTLNAAFPAFAAHRSGYDDQVNLAQSGKLQMSSAVVLWLSFPRAEEREKWDGYLRGEYLSQFNGAGWTTLKTNRWRTIYPDSNGVFSLHPQHSRPNLIRYAVTLIDTSADTLFNIGRPVRILGPLPTLRENESGSLHGSAALKKPVRYEATSEIVMDQAAEPLDLELPSMPLERVRALADKTAGNGPTRLQAERLEQFLRKNYRYTLTFGEVISKNPVVDFLFKRREGSCGHFASALALMLRMRHIPSRVVAGYYKGEWNDLGQAVVIRERDAHAWVEAYIQGEGWVSFDPTPSPAADVSWIQRLSSRFLQMRDYVGLEWNRFVIQYDLYSQIRAFEHLKGTSDRWGTGLSRWWERMSFRYQHSRRLPAKLIAIPFMKIGSLVMLIGVSYVLLSWRKREDDQAPVRFYDRFLKKMSRAGYPKAAAETGREFALRIAHGQPKYAAIAHLTTDRYYQLRFGGNIS